MSGSVELDPGGEHLLIRFPYREDLVEEVRALPGRRWDRGAKLWRVPADQVEKVYQTFTKHFFHFAPEVSGLLAGTVRPAKGKQKGGQQKLRLVGSEDDEPGDATGSAPPPSPTADTVTVSALNQRVRDALQGQFAEPLWVVGEVVGYDRARKGSHLFFSLAEKQEGDSRPRATVDAVLYETTARWLLPELAKGDQPLTLQDGIEIRALVRVDLYVPRGRFQVVIERIDPGFTLGKMALDRERILAELRKAALDKKNATLPLPVPALRIGVLTSPDADGWTDFCRQLQESGIGFQLTLFPVRVQGPQLKPTLLAGLSWFADHADEFDALCIVRGGGSRTDLAWFDDLDLALAVARHPLKVLCGIGHQRDQSVLDLIAHSEKTPTALGAFLVEQVLQAEAALAQQTARLQEVVQSALHERQRELAARGRDLLHATHHRLAREGAAIAGACHRLRNASQRRLEQARAAWHRTASAVGAAGTLRLERAAAALQRGTTALVHAAHGHLERASASLQRHQDRLRLLDPQAVLRRGYALLRGEDGRVLPDAAAIRPGDRLRIRMRDGTVRARAEDTELD